MSGNGVLVVSVVHVASLFFDHTCLVIRSRGEGVAGNISRCTDTGRYDEFVEHVHLSENGGGWRKGMSTDGI